MSVTLFTQTTLWSLNVNPKPRHQNYVKIECSCLKCGRTLQARIIKSRKILWGFAHDHKNTNVKCGESLISRKLKLEFYYIWIILLQGKIILVLLNNKPTSAGVTIPLDVYVAHCGCRHQQSSNIKSQKIYQLQFNTYFFTWITQLCITTWYFHLQHEIQIICTSEHSFQTFIAGLCVPNCAQCTVKEFKFKTPTYGAGVWI